MCTLYDNIKGLCDRDGISGAELCKRVGVSKSTLTSLKTGRTKTIKTENLCRIAEYFKVSVEELLTEESIKKEPTLSDGLLSERELAAFQEYLKLSESAKAQAQSFVHNLLISESH